MTQEIYPFSDLDILISRQYHRRRPSTAPRTFIRRVKNTPSETLFTQLSKDLFITQTDKPTIALNDTTKKRKSTIPHNNSFRDRKRTKKLYLYIPSLKTQNFSST